MPDTPTKYETIRSMRVNGIPNNVTIHIQRQTGGKIPGDVIQFGLAATWINEKGDEVWGSPPKWQLEQIPELVEMMQSVFEKYSKEKSEKTQKNIDVYPGIHVDMTQ